MLKTETAIIDGREFTRTYSDTYLIRKVGTDEIYTEALDVLAYTYEETDMALEAQSEADGYEGYYNAMQEVITGS